MNIRVHLIFICLFSFRKKIIRYLDLEFYGMVCLYLVSESEMVIKKQSLKDLCVDEILELDSIN